MPIDEKNGARTHEPSLREITAELDGLRELFKSKYEALAKIMDERDKLYTERAVSSKNNIDVALKAAEILNNTIFAAGEKAIAKSDINSDKWRENANEWRGAMMDREAKFASRQDIESEFKSVRVELASLRESRSEGAGRSAGVHYLWAAGVAAVGALLGLVSIVVAILRH